MAAPWNGQPQWWLQLISLGALAWQLQREASWRRGFLQGWVFAIAWLTATFWWLFISMHVYGGLAAPLAVAAVLGLAAFLGLYYAAACGIFVALARTGASWGAIVFAALWLLAELLRGSLFTGFPWGAGAYAHVDGVLAGYAPWVGAYGMSFVAAMVACGLVGVARYHLAAATAPLGALAVGLMLAQSGGYTVDSGSTTVTLLQGNIAQDEKFQSGTGVPMALNWYGGQLREAKTGLVVAPETAIPLLPQQLPDGYLSAVAGRFFGGNQAALIGIPLGNASEGYTNSVIGMKPGAAEDLYHYDKHHLVPFGEFIPPLFRWFTDLMNIPLGDFNRGAMGQASFEWQGQRFALNICYEDLFGEELGALFADPQQAPTVFVNVSNIAWFGNTVAIDQHLAISRLRALEFERPMLRATNTGATAIIDHHGRVTHSLQRHTRGVLVGEVQGRSGITPFAWWVSRAGLWPLWLLAILVIALAAARRNRVPDDPLSAFEPSAPAGPR